MFKCDECGTVSAPGQSSHEVVLEIRSKTYAPPPMPTDKRGKKRGRRELRGGMGWETAKSAVMCARCAADAEERLASKIAALAVPAEEPLAAAS